MERRILSKKIAIQIVVLIFSFFMLAMGATAAGLCSSSYFVIIADRRYSGYLFNISDIFFGVAICILSIMLMIVSSIKLRCYSIMKNNLKKSEPQPQAVVFNSAATNSLAQIREQLCYLQQMEHDGLISAEECEKLRKDVLSKQ